MKTKSAQIRQEAREKVATLRKEMREKQGTTPKGEKAEDKQSKRLRVLNSLLAGRGEPRMAKAEPKKIRWLLDVAEPDYAAAESYLSIIYSVDRVSAIMAKFRRAAIVQFKGKDIFRASQLSLLGLSNSHVEKDRKKISEGKGLSPLLMVRDKKNGKVVIADGYHRLCAIYSVNEDASIQCKIV